MEKNNDRQAKTTVNVYSNSSFLDITESLWHQKIFSRTKTIQYIDKNPLFVHLGITF